MTDQLFLWLDYETDHLDPRDLLPLEVAGFITTSDLHVMRGTEFHWLLEMTPAAVEHVRETCVDVVRKMHDENGLWNALTGKTEGGLDRIPVGQMESRMVSLVAWAQAIDPREHLWEGEETLTRRPEGGYKRGPKVSGSGVSSFDLQIIRFQKPLLAEVIDYRTCDVSNIRCFLRDQCHYDIDSIFTHPEVEKVHRAPDDALEAWLHALRLRDHMGSLSLPLLDDLDAISRVDGDYAWPGEVDQ